MPRKRRNSEPAHNDRALTAIVQQTVDSPSMMLSCIAHALRNRQAPFNRDDLASAFEGVGKAFRVAGYGDAQRELAAIVEQAVKGWSEDRR